MITSELYFYNSNIHVSLEPGYSGNVGTSPASEIKCGLNFSFYNVILRYSWFNLYSELCKDFYYSASEYHGMDVYNSHQQYKFCHCFFQVSGITHNMCRFICRMYNYPIKVKLWVEVTFLCLLADGLSPQSSFTYGKYKGLWQEVTHWVLRFATRQNTATQFGYISMRLGLSCPCSDFEMD